MIVIIRKIVFIFTHHYKAIIMKNKQAIKSIVYKIDCREKLANKEDATQWLNKGKDWMKINLQKFYQDLKNEDFNSYPHTQEGINFLQRKLIANRNVAKIENLLFSIRHQFILEARQIKQTLNMFEMRKS